MDFSRAVWRKSSRSVGNGDNCVEVAAVWRKASRSAGNGDACVEVAPAGHAVAVRDSKNPDGPKLAVAPRAWSAFTDTIRTGTLDG